MLVGAKHLEDKLSVIAKNSSPNASPVQLSVVSRKKITHYQLPITHYQLKAYYDYQLKLYYHH
ncbi:MAG: hypothetical protein HEQ25_16430 [Dolichospermum sp. DET73]|nr:hypothetical protein [Dolichospermum sp. DET73]